MPRLRVDGLDRTIEVPPGANLHRALRQEHVNLHWTVWGKLLNCRGLGLCALCRVRVLEGAETLPPRTKREEKRLRGKPPEWRLACQVAVRGDLRIEPFPLVPLEARYGAKAVRLAQSSPEAREEWVRGDRGARREERRRLAIEQVGATRRKRRGGLLGRLQRKKSDEPEAAAGKGKKPAKPKTRRAAKREPGRPKAARRGLPLRKKKDRGGPGAQDK